MNLTEEAKQIKTREDLIIFIKLLSKDLSENKVEWENDNLENYLRAITAWLNDMQGFYKNNDIPFNEDVVNWKVFGEILLASKVYE